MSNMKFKDGNRVEICRADGGTLQSWYRARVISHNRDYYRVQYDNLLTEHGNHLVEDVYADTVRPEPPTMTETRKLGPGDMIEVYDNHSWREGRVIKALPSRLFVVKLMEPLRQRTFHQSVIRPRLFWENDSWLHNVEVGRDHLARMKFQEGLHIGCQLQEQKVKRNIACQEHGQVVAEYHPHKLISKNAKRKSGSCMQSAYEGDLKTEAAPQKKRLIQTFRHQGAVEQPSFPMLEKVDTFPFPRIHEGEECVRMSSFEDRINLSVEKAESTECSVASSSSSNELNYVLHSDKKLSKRPSINSHFDDAQSSCECPNGRPSEPLTEKEVATKLHKLELRAYCSTMRAFHASGCLTWEREALLSNLRFELHISDDEHFSELTRLCSTKAL